MQSYSSSGKQQRPAMAIRGNRSHPLDNDPLVSNSCQVKLDGQAGPVQHAKKDVIRKDFDSDGEEYGNEEGDMFLEYGDEEDQLRKEEEERQNLMLAIRKKHQQVDASDSVRNPVDTTPPVNSEEKVTSKDQHAQTHSPPNEIQAETNGVAEVEECKDTVDDNNASENNLKLDKKHSVQKDILERERENYYSRLAENEI